MGGLGLSSCSESRQHAVLQLADPLFGSQSLLRKQTARGAAACRSTVWVSVLAQKAESTVLQLADPLHARVAISLQRISHVFAGLSLHSFAALLLHGLTSSLFLCFARFCGAVVAQLCSVAVAC